MISQKILTRLNEIEVVLGVKFNDISLLMRAFTHVSAVGGAEPRLLSYQRLEFLGDHVLGLVVSDMLYSHYPTADEGELSKRLADLVRAETCAEIAEELELHNALRLGNSEMNAGIRKKSTIHADICEAVLGAVFLDKGYAEVDNLIRRLWNVRMLNPKRPLRDSKTALQEWAQSKGLPVPHYDEIERSGPDHAPIFKIKVTVNGFPQEIAVGTTKRIAEQQAAHLFLVREGAFEDEVSFK